jgi:hypothetical protein
MHRLGECQIQLALAALLLALQLSQGQILRK